jgi:hypothetical protein
MCERHVRLGDGSISIPVGVSKRESGRKSTLDDEVSAMRGAMMRRTQDDESIRVVVSTFRTKLDVMNIDEDSMTATRNHATSTVSSDDMTPNRGWNRLLGAGQCPFLIGRLGHVRVVLGAAMGALFWLHTHVGGAGGTSSIVFVA